MRLSNLLIFAAILAAIFIVPALAAPGDVFSLSGQVVDRYGNPVQGADVTLMDNNYKTIAVKTTNENGNYDFINVVSNTDTVTIRVNLTRDGTTYAIPSYYTRWYPAKSIQYVPTNETTFPNYPAPTDGYLYGAIQTGEGNVANFISGIVYLVNIDNDVKYYQIADRTDGKASFTFYAPAGQYMLYAQHWENGKVYESAHKAVNITPNGDVTEVLETRIILPLSTPSTTADPATEPSHYQNTISGKVVTMDNKPVAGTTVTLLETADNGSAFIPMKGTDGILFTTSTDANGNYRFSGIAPTTDDGKAIQAMKSICAAVQYQNSAGDMVSMHSGARDLYYPDVILGYGHEINARNVTIPDIVIPYAGDGWVRISSEPQGAFIYVDDQQLFGPESKPITTPGDVYISAGTHAIKLTKEGYSDATDIIKMEAGKQHADYALTLEKSAVPSGLAFLPLLAAIAIGILCLVGLYLFLNRKGQ